MAKAKTTTRSYTLRLGIPAATLGEAPKCPKARAKQRAAARQPSWQRLFDTHLAVCNGARVYGEVLLNLRGGLAAVLAVNAANREVEELKKARAQREQKPMGLKRSVSDEEQAKTQARDASQHRLVLRGARRMLSLGWLSVEDDRASAHHRHRVMGCNVGASLHEEQAKDLLTSIMNSKNVPFKEQAEWIADCLPAITARIRDDAVWVNRAVAFCEWQAMNLVEADQMVDHARSILTKLCGESLIALPLPLPPDELARPMTDGSESEEGAKAEEEESQGRATTIDADADPSNASRGIFGDLFGGDAAEKTKRAAGKRDFATAIGAFLRRIPIPSKGDIEEFRTTQGLTSIDPQNLGRFPEEVASSGAPTTIATRYRKLLVSLGVWPDHHDENGSNRASAAKKHRSKLNQTMDAATQKVAINAADLLDACPEQSAEAIETQEASMPARVFTPAWAGDVASRVAQVTRMPIKCISQNEFKRLMLALAARRLSQTQTWTRLNELTRHNAALRADEARARLTELDPQREREDWLRGYEVTRTNESNSLDEFFITKRMIGECEVIMRRWEETASPGARVTEAVEVQQESEKFGDARLYRDLAHTDSGESRWAGIRGSEVLTQWVKLRKAQQDQRRGKVPRFCHPDPFRHPTWVEFGESSKPKVWYQFGPTGLPANVKCAKGIDGFQHMWLRLTDSVSGKATDEPLRWSSKRLRADLGDCNAKEEDVSRADRLSMAAARLPQVDAFGMPKKYRPRAPFLKGAKGWNARLQLDRRTLLLLERQWDRGTLEWRDGGKALRSSRWFATFAPQLAMTPSIGSKVHPELGWRSRPHKKINENRQGAAKLILSRLPGLRIISVDLGHRHAAACAVWEALSGAQMNDACKQAGGREPTEFDLYMHLKWTDQAKRSRTMIYRRISGDMITNPKTGDASLAPAPWARLERQFLIKLPGEEKSSRAASNAGPVNETAMVATLAKKFGQVVADEFAKGRAVDELMGRSVRLLGFGLKRHARRAKIAYAIDPATKSIPAIGGCESAFTPADSAHVGLVVDALVEWHALATDAKWNDKGARELWNEHIRGVLGGWHIGEPNPLNEGSARSTRQQRGKDEDAMRSKLTPIAERLVSADRANVHAAWRDRWQGDDGHAANVDKATGRKSSDGVGLHGDIRWVTDWIMGKRLAGATGDSWKKNVGGLSVTRITTMKALYQLHKAFAMRAMPTKPRGAPERGESNVGIAQSILIAMERMRNQRVKQIASRIAGSALGLGGRWISRKSRDGKREKSVWVEDAVPKYETCHAVVIENLKKYRPDETQTRRENRQLMSWASAKIEKYLGEACQLNGLHLRTVSAGYTSRQDSRTGAPGIRCSDVSANDFRQKQWWRRAVEVAKERLTVGKADALGDYLCAIDKQLCSATSGNGAVRIPRPGGDLFVSADPSSPAAKGLQADLNAAANIGMKALLDPDWAGRWWFIPCAAATNVPTIEGTEGSAVIPNAALMLIAASVPTIEREKAAKKEREVVYLWRDPSAVALSEGAGWYGTAAYWNDVRSRVVSSVLRSQEKPKNSACTESLPW